MVGFIFIEWFFLDDNSFLFYNLMYLFFVENNLNLDFKLVQISFEFYIEGDING